MRKNQKILELEELIKIINPDQKILSLTTLCENSNVAATALGLAYLNQYCESKKNEWVLIEKKALRWIKKQVNDYQALVNKFKESLVV